MRTRALNVPKKSTANRGENRSSSVDALLLYCRLHLLILLLLLANKGNGILLAAGVAVYNMRIKLIDISGLLSFFFSFH